MAKETCAAEKRPVCMAKEACLTAKETYTAEKRPVCMARETYAADDKRPTIRTDDV